MTGYKLKDRVRIEDIRKEITNEKGRKYKETVVAVCNSFTVRIGRKNKMIRTPNYYVMAENYLKYGVRI